MEPHDLRDLDLTDQRPTRLFLDPCPEVLRPIVRCGLYGGTETAPIHSDEVGIQSEEELRKTLNVRRIDEFQRLREHDS